MKKMRALGIMSGNSLDAIDLSLITTNAANIVHREFSSSIDFPCALREKMNHLIDNIYQYHKVDYTQLLLLENHLSKVYAESVLQFIKKYKIDLETVEVIGCHGQTITHNPEIGITSQLCNGNILAWICKRPVVCDFRRLSVASGGQGAPLAPIYHKAITSTVGKPLAFVNIGGISNITWIGPEGELLFFDTGPGNTLLDAWVSSKTDGKDRFDKDGLYAKNGSIIKPILDELMAIDYFNRKPPKSLDKDFFDAIVMKLLAGVNLYDGCATLSAFTASTISGALRLLPIPPQFWIFTGGGSKNPFILSLIRTQVIGEFIDNASNPLFEPCSLESAAFAYLAARSIRHLPITYDIEGYPSLPKEPTINGGSLFYPESQSKQK